MLLLTLHPNPTANKEKRICTTDGITTNLTLLCLHFFIVVTPFPMCHNTFMIQECIRETRIEPDGKHGCLLYITTLFFLICRACQSTEAETEKRDSPWWRRWCPSASTPTVIRFLTFASDIILFCILVPSSSSIIGIESAQSRMANNRYLSLCSKLMKIRELKVWIKLPEIKETKVLRSSLW